MRLIHFSFLGKGDGMEWERRIYGDLYLPDTGVPLRAVIQFVHGMDEHFGRYREFAEFLCARGVALCGEDHRGHGRSTVCSSAGNPIFGSFSANENGWNLVLSDLWKLRRALKRHFPNVPYLLLGHSMGSFLVRSMLAAKELPGWEMLADGMILSGTAYHEAAVLEAGRALVKRFIQKKGREAPFSLAVNSSAFLYNLRIHNPKTPIDWVAADPKTVQKHLDDPFCGHTPTAGLFDDMLGGLMAVCAGTLVRRIPVPMPTLFIAGKCDPVGDFGAGVRKTAALFRVCGCPSVTVKLYPDARHEVLLETCRQTVYEDVDAWICDAVLKKQF
ncbi:MAG: alpha/beta fold hydrolase [Clostridia bacterium]|nr:alpha/beta fold hydrolase [Clostridia bacterium]